MTILDQISPLILVILDSFKKIWTKIKIILCLFLLVLTI